MPKIIKEVDEYIEGKTLTESEAREYIKKSPALDIERLLQEGRIRKLEDYFKDRGLL